MIYHIFVHSHIIMAVSYYFNFNFVGNIFFFISLIANSLLLLGYITLCYGYLHTPNETLKELTTSTFEDSNEKEISLIKKKTFIFFAFLPIINSLVAFYFFYPMKYGQNVFILSVVNLIISQTILMITRKTFLQSSHNINLSN